VPLGGFVFRAGTGCLAKKMRRNAVKMSPEGSRRATTCKVKVGKNGRLACWRCKTNQDSIWLKILGFVTDCINYIADFYVKLAK